MDAKWQSYEFLPPIPLGFFFKKPFPATSQAWKD
jgi:hypothetical protein